MRMLVDLTEHRDESYVALKDIAERQNISKKYLEQIVPLMNKAGILKANRGYQGGYILAKNPEQITVGEVLRVTEGSIAPVACLDFDPIRCERADQCKTLFIWEGLYKRITEYLDSITIQDIINNSAQNSYDNYII